MPVGGTEGRNPPPHTHTPFSPPTSREIKRNCRITQMVKKADVRGSHFIDGDTEALFHLLLYLLHER